MGQSPRIFYSPQQPDGDAPNVFSRILREMLSAPDVRVACAGQREDLCPATDDRPFFNQTVRWRSLRPDDFLEIFHAGDYVNVLVKPVAEVMLVTILVQAIIVSAVLILLPLKRFAARGLHVPRPWKLLTYFAMLGLGFIMIEIVMLQRFALYLGQPVYTFSVVLAGLLIFTGIGASAVRGFGERHRQALVGAVLCILAVLALFVFGGPWLLKATLGFSLASRVMIVIAMLAPLGIVLGMPFPIGLRIVGEDSPAFVPWAWGVNGFFTVIGSIGASILGMALGFSVVMGISGACYLLALVSITTLNRRIRTNERDATAGISVEFGTSAPS